MNTFLSSALRCHDTLLGQPQHVVGSFSWDAHCSPVDPFLWAGEWFVAFAAVLIVIVLAAGAVASIIVKRREARNA